MHGRPGASYISLSFPDGTFEGAFVDEDGELRFQVSRVLDGFTEERVFDYGERETLTLRELRKSKYDPRTRPFYKLALAGKSHVWTDPYTFARTGDTGITRTRALRLGGAIEHAVLTVDFDVRRLSPLLARRDAKTSARFSSTPRGRSWPTSKRSSWPNALVKIPACSTTVRWAIQCSPRSSKTSRSFRSRGSLPSKRRAAPTSLRRHTCRVRKASAGRCLLGAGGDLPR